MSFFHHPFQVNHQIDFFCDVSCNLFIYIPLLENHPREEPPDWLLHEPHLFLSLISESYQIDSIERLVFCLIQVLELQLMNNSYVSTVSVLSKIINQHIYSLIMIWGLSENSFCLNCFKRTYSHIFNKLHIAI